MSMFSFISAENLIVIGAALQAFLVVVFVWNALLVRDVKGKRMRAIQDQQKALQNKTLNPARSTFTRPASHECDQ